MREVRFRAWDKFGKGQMLYNFLLDCTGRGEIWVFTPDGCKLRTGEGGSITLMQYTGLHDRNGKEVYEGDLLFHPNEDGLTRVEWAQCSWVVVDAFSGEAIISLYDDGPERFAEVIGNIYENPELLKE